MKGTLKSNTTPTGNDLKDKADVYADKRKNQWGLFATGAIGGAWHAHLLQVDNEYASPVNQDIIASTNKRDLVDAIDDWVDDWEGTHMQPPTVATTDSSGLFALLVLLVIVLTDKKGGR
jgi:hypothetical protein